MATLNIGKFEQHILEVYRIWHSLCLGTPVISERGTDVQLSRTWARYVNFVTDLDQLNTMKIDVTGPKLYAAESSLKDEVARLQNWMEQHIKI
jgi:predicted mannosyl-3-phosphoglycerate phosphatase (HAD superfamily)